MLLAYVPWQWVRTMKWQIKFHLIKSLIWCYIYDEPLSLFSCFCPRSTDGDQWISPDVTCLCQQQWRCHSPQGAPEDHDTPSLKHGWLWEKILRRRSSPRNIPRYPTWRPKILFLNDAKWSSNMFKTTRKSWDSHALHLGRFIARRKRRSQILGQCPQLPTAGSPDMCVMSIASKSNEECSQAATHASPIQPNRPEKRM